MEQAARALHEVAPYIEFIKKLLPLEPYEDLESPPLLVYKDQIDWITNHATINPPSQSVLSASKANTWQQMLANLESVNRVRHPNTGEAYIKWRSQDMLVRRLWNGVQFPGEDPDAIYTRIRHKYCIAARKLVEEKDTDLNDSTLVYLQETYHKKLIAARKAKVSNASSSFSDRIASIKAKKNKEAAEKIENDDEFVIVEAEEADEEEYDWEQDDWEENEWEEDDWDMASGNPLEAFLFPETYF